MSEGPAIFSEQVTEALINEGRRRFVMSLRTQNGRRKRWRRNEELMAAQHFNAFPNMPEDKSKIVYNACHEVVETIMPIMIDLTPVPEIEPDPASVEGVNMREFTQVAESLEAGIEDQWEKADLDELWPMAVKSSLVYGNGPGRMLDYRKKLIIDLIDIFTWFLTPHCKSYKWSQWIITATPVFISEIIDVYGTSKSKGLQPEGKLDNYRTYHLFRQGALDTAPHSISHATPETSSQDDFVATNEYGKGERLGQVLLIDIWSMHDLEKSINLEKTATGEGSEAESPLSNYQHLVFAGKNILDYQRETKYEIGKPPFFDIVNYPSPNSPWGMGEPDQLESMNMAINIVLSEATDGAAMAGSPPVKVSADIIKANPGGIKMRAGKKIIVPHRGSVLEWMQSWQMPPYMQSLPIMFIDFSCKLQEFN